MAESGRLIPEPVQNISFRHQGVFGPSDPHRTMRASTPACASPGTRTARMKGYSGRDRSGLRPARPTRASDRIRPARAVVAAFPAVGLNRRPSPVLRVSLPDDPETLSRQQGSHVTPQVPPQRASRVLARSFLPMVSLPPYPLWCG